MGEWEGEYKGRYSGIYPLMITPMGLDAGVLGRRGPMVMREERCCGAIDAAKPAWLRDARPVVRLTPAPG